MKTILTLIATALLFSSCASLQNLPAALGTPQSVQAELTLLGGAVKSHIPADAQARIHQGASYLVQAADLDLNLLTQYLPVTTGSQNGDFLVGKAKEILAYVKDKYGSHNQTTIAYARAVGNALLANF